MIVCGGGFMAFFCFLRSIAGATAGASVGTRDNIPLARARRSQSSRWRGELEASGEATVVNFRVGRGKSAGVGIVVERMRGKWEARPRVRYGGDS